MSSNATLGVETRARKRTRERRDANAANAGEAIPGLLNDIVVTHVLRSEHFDDPADLARLPAVSCAMRDAVAATGLAFEELDELDAVKARMFKRVEAPATERSPVASKIPLLGSGEGRASRGAAVGARERLPVGRDDVQGGGAERTPRGAAVVARERLPVERVYVLVGGEGRTLRGAAVGARERLPVEQVDVHVCGEERAS